MANLSLNQNQLFQTAIIGMVTNDPQPLTVAAQLDPNSSWATPITSGQSVKLTNTASSQIMVEPCSADTDAVFGVIPYNLRKNSYVLGDVIEVVADGGIIMLETSAAVNRGAFVAITNQTVSTNDPTIAATTTAGKAIAGKALEKATAAGALIKVLIQPGLYSGAGAAAVAGRIGS